MKKKGLLVFISILFLGGLLAILLYFNCFNLQKYFLPKYIKLPVQYLPCSDLPLVEVEIEKKNYLMEWDSGSFQFVELRKEVLDSILNKKENGFSEHYDMKGNKYTDPQFIIPYISFNHRKFRPLLATQENVQFIMEGCQIGIVDKKRIDERQNLIHGTIGMRMFEGICIFFDLPHSLIYIAKDKDALKGEKAFSLQGFTEVPLVGKEIAVIRVETEMGPKRLLLDTGASLSVLKDPEISEFKLFTVDHLVIGGKDFGPQKFIEYNFSEMYREDGILGIDFFKRHPIFLDTKNQQAWIGPECSDNPH